MKPNLSTGSLMKGGVEKEISVQQLLTFLLRDVEKTKHYRRLPFYLIFLAVFTTLVIMTGLGDVWFNERSDHNHAIAALFNKNELKTVRTQNEMWAWLEATTRATWVDSSTVETPEEVCQHYTVEESCKAPCAWNLTSCVRASSSIQNVGLGFLLLRQWRVEKQVCPESEVSSVRKVLPAAVVSGLPKRCSPGWPGGVTTEAYGPNNEFHSDAGLGGSKVGADVESSTAIFKRSDQFSQKLMFSEPLSSVLTNLTRLRTEGWVTMETRLVGLSAVFFNPNTDTFVSNDAYIEYYHTGRVRTGYRGRPFPIFSLDNTHDTILFVLDAFHLVASVPLLLWSLVRTTQDQLTWMKAPGSSPFGIWQLYEALHIAAHIATCVYRIDLWVRSLHMTRDGYYGDSEAENLDKMFNALVAYSESWVNGWGWCGAAIVMSYLRIFKYLQYNQRLCVLSETVRTAAGDLAGMTIIFTVVISAYAFGGTMLYAWEMEEFTSFGTSFAYLLQVLFAGEIVGGIWDDLIQIHTVWTPIYMLTYFLLSWVVLLNMVIAALSNAFILVVQQQSFYRRSASASGQHMGIWHAIRKGARKCWERLRPAPQSGRKDPTEFLMLRTNRLKQRYTTITGSLKVLAERKWEAAGDGSTSLEDIQRRYSDIYVTWGEVAACLEETMTPTEMETLFGRVHKLIACDEQSSTILHLSQRYCAQLGAKVAELLQLTRLTASTVDQTALTVDKVAKLPNAPGNSNNNNNNSNNNVSFVQAREVVNTVPPAPPPSMPAPAPAPREARRNSPPRRKRSDTASSDSDRAASGRWFATVPAARRAGNRSHRDSHDTVVRQQVGDTPSSSPHSPLGSVTQSDSFVASNNTTRSGTGAPSSPIKWFTDFQQPQQQQQQQQQPQQQQQQQQQQRWFKPINPTAPTDPHRPLLPKTLSDGDVEMREIAV